VTAASLVPPGLKEAQTALVLRDVTQEDALRSLRAYFLANISHEFRTPLSTLNAFMELLLDPAEALTAEEMRELIKPSYLSLRTLQTLIDNLLASSNIEAGQFNLTRRRVTANQILENAVRLAGPLLERRRQAITVSEPAELPELDADPTRLTLALVNLLVNASKYSPIGEPIDIQIKQKGNMLGFYVADRGPGVPTNERLNLFRRYVRLNSVDEEQYGIGLGLFVVKSTIEAHGGSVGIEDNPGGGSVFWFELPLSAVESPL
jgi:signal transduction histidine kinase